MIEGHLCLFESDCPIDTLSLPYMQGTDLSVQVVRWSKPSLSLLRRPLWVAILCEGGHQTQQCCRINLLVPRACAAASGARAIGDLEPRVNAVGNCCTLSRTLRFVFIFEVVIIRYDKVARDRERVHMIITCA